MSLGVLAGFAACWSRPRPRECSPGVVSASRAPRSSCGRPPLGSSRCRRHRVVAVTEVARAPQDRITLLSKPGCHLCDDARALIERVAAELGVGWKERDITASPEDLREYWDKIPVPFVDGVQVDFWWVDESRLRTALGPTL